MKEFHYFTRKKKIRDSTWSDISNGSPLIAAVEVQYESTADDVAELNLNLASPKSPTWATISLSRRMLLGFRSQCTMVPWW